MGTGLFTSISSRRAPKEERKNVLDALKRFGATYEGANAELYAIDLKPGVDFDEVADSLQEFEDKGLLEARYAPQPQPVGPGELVN